MAMLSMSAAVDRSAIPRTHVPVLVLVGALSAIVLVLTSNGQIFDANFIDLTEATSLLAGDRPFRDFYEVGMPLAAYSAAATQLVSGHRLIGELLRQWCFIVAGMVVACHLGIRLSRSPAATLLMMGLPIIVLAEAPTYHYSKLFFFPLAIWMAWRYLDAPGVRRGAALGATAAVAFLFRHDFGVYIGFGSVMAFVLARAAVAASRRPRAMVSDVAAYTLAVAAVVAPWAAVVQANEGLLAYTKARALLYEGAQSPYRLLLKQNPLRLLMPDPALPPAPGVVAFAWPATVPYERRRQLVGAYRLHLLHDGGITGQWRYAVANVDDVRLLRLQPYIADTEGIDWDRLRERRWHLPNRDNAAAWLLSMALLVPVFLLTAAGLETWNSWRRGAPAPPDVWRMLFAGIFLALVDTALFRETSYVVIVAPVTAALGARFLVARTAVMRTCAIAVLVLTSYATLVWVRGTPLFRPAQLTASVRGTFAQLLAVPPDYGDPSFRYLRDCTPPGNHLLITGMAPLHVSYYANRPFAGGHIRWHTGWRSDPDSEARSLALLQRQSVPIVFSTHDPVLVDFRRYPRITDYLMQHYVPVEGSDGQILVDRRRQPVSQYGPRRWPCFR
jgi:hypothetical protein